MSAAVASRQIQGAKMPPNAAYPFALDDDATDGKDWKKVDKFPDGHELLPMDNKTQRDWLYKLGRMLRDQLFPRDIDKIYYLEKLPEHYHLRVKRSGNNRSDYYLYGHPDPTKQGGPRAFRSPNDFFPHLLFLAGGTKDRKNCTCILCSPDGQVAVPEPRNTQASRAAASKATAKGTSQSAASSTSKGSPVPTRAASKSSAESTPQAQPLVPNQDTTLQSEDAADMDQSQSQAPNETQPTEVDPPVQQPVEPVQQTADSVQQAPPESMQQAHPVQEPPLQMYAAPDEQQIFRCGEVVWWKQNTAWRLGLILQCLPDTQPDQAAQQRFLLRPLAYEFLALPEVEKPISEMRPFLAFSVPTVNASLGPIRDQPMYTINWQHVEAQVVGGDQQKKELLALEASKIAATTVNRSYSVFNHLGPDSRFGYPKFGGVFLGAEKINLNEAVRISVHSSEMDESWGKNMPIVLAVRGINVAVLNDQEGLYFYGDIWRLEERQGPATASPDNSWLPEVMVREREFRNQVKEARGTHFQWVSFARDRFLSGDSVSGRFYETTKLMEILDPVRYHTALQQHEILEVQLFLNKRFDASAQTFGRRTNRAETLRGAIPLGPEGLSFGSWVNEEPVI